MILFLGVGLCLALVIKTWANEDIRVNRNLFSTGSLYTTNQDIENVRIQNERLTNVLEKNEDKILGYEEALANQGGKLEEGDISETITAYVEGERRDLQILDGTIAVSGPGVRVTLEDSDAEIKKGENPNNYLVHNSDVLAVINDLRAAGAEGIALNGFRVTAASNVDCGGAVINVDHQISSPPFVIEAIGDPDSMIVYLNSVESAIQILKYSEIKVNIERSELVILEKSTLY